MLRAALDDIEGSQNFEQLWSKQLDQNLFEICCVPFFAYDLALGDVVRADQDTGYVIQSVQNRSGNGVARVAIKSADDVARVHQRLHDLLERLVYLHEWFAPGYVAIHLEQGRQHDDLFAGLAELGDAVEIEQI